MRDDSITLYIPMGVKTETELFSGFGRKQLIQSFLGSGCAGVLAVFFWLFSQNVALTVVTVLTGVAGSVTMTTKDTTNLSVVDHIGNMLRFSGSQKVYPYKYGNEWE